MAKEREFDFPLMVGSHKCKDGDVCLNTSGNIAVVGTTGSGKTYVVKSLIHSLMYQSSGKADFRVVSRDQSYMNIFGERATCVFNPEQALTAMEKFFQEACDAYKSEGMFTMIFVDGLDSVMWMDYSTSVNDISRLRHLFENAYNNGVTWVVTSQSYRDKGWRNSGIDDFRGIIYCTCIEGCWPGLETRTDQWTAAKKKENGYDEFSLSVEQVWSTIKDDGCMSGIVYPGVKLYAVTDEMLTDMYNTWA